MGVRRLIVIALLVLLVAVANRFLGAYDRKRAALDDTPAADRELCDAYLAWSAKTNQVATGMERLCRVPNAKPPK